MLLDAGSIEPGSTLRTEVCIVGSGPAGMTLALELMQERIGVVVLEAGDEEAEWRPAELRGEVEGPYPRPESTRRRGFGGTSLGWNLESDWTPDGGLRCHALEPGDFERRPGVPNSGWPFGYEELEPYYERAHEIMGLGKYDYSVEGIESEDEQPLGLSGSIQTMAFRFAHRNAFRDLRPRLIGSEDVTVVLHAEATEVETQDGPQRVSRIRAGAGERQFWVEARVYALAGGGIENARLLLLSDRTQPAGLGNGNDLAGRYFMDHLTTNGGYVEPSTPDFWRRIELYRRKQRGGAETMAAWSLSEATAREKELSAVIFSPFIGRRVFFQRSVHSLSSFVFHMRRGHLPPVPLRQLKNILQDPLPPIVASYLRLTNQITKKRDFFGLRVHYEQIPDPENRVTLSTERDELGLRRPKLIWRTGEIEERALRRGLAILDEELRAAGIGSVKNDLGPEPVLPGITHHHMGTTRMHDDPKHGVVDADCRLHGTGNLFIAGSSVMPTGGAATVTLTLVALTIRLADYLKRELSKTESVVTSGETADA